MRVISNEELKEMLGDASVRIIDVREEHEFRRGHIPRSIWIPLEELPGAATAWPLDTKVIIICNTVNRSAAACRFLERHGFTDVAYVVPGIQYWDGDLVVDDILVSGTESKKEARIYLDHAATTPVDPQVAEAVIKWLTEGFGNPSSVHAYGRKSLEAMAKARRQVAELIGARDKEIIFTSGGTEADNAALLGIMQAWGPKRRRVITSAIEHSAILANIPRLQAQGIEVTVIPVDYRGFIDMEAYCRALGPDVGLVSVMYANNEVGTIQPIKDIAILAHEVGALVHTDAVQGVGLCEIDVDDLGVDALTLSGHKLYGPKGIGALFLREGTPFEPFIRGGGQEDGRRAGTENLPGIVGLGVACQLAKERLPKVGEIAKVRDFLQAGLAKLPGVTIYGHPTLRLANNLCITIEGAAGYGLVLDLDLAGIACSSGSACHRNKPSYVLQAMGVSEDLAKQAIRFSLGWENTIEQAQKVIEVIAALIS